MTQRKPRVTGYPVAGSERHVSKTNGSHNGRWDRFPHLSDVLDRPKKLGGDVVSTAPRWKGSKARRAQVRINPFNYQDPAIGIPQSPSWWVGVRIKDWVTGKTFVQETAITARHEGDAAAYAQQITEKLDNVLFLGIVSVTRLDIQSPINDREPKGESR